MKYSSAPFTSSTFQLKKIEHSEIQEVAAMHPAFTGKKSLPLEKKSNLVFKRLFDVVFSLMLIILIFSWLMPLIAVLIRMDSKGPVFFLQKRNKKNNRLFTCIKFRTMVPNHSSDLEPACENDSRITRLGKILRKYYIDE